MAQSNRINIQCVYPRCRRVFPISFRPIPGQEIYCTVCGEPFFYYSRYQAREDDSPRIRQRTRAPQPPSSIPYLDHWYWKLWQKFTKATPSVKWLLVVGFVGIVAVASIVTQIITNGQTDQDIETELNRPAAIPSDLRQYQIPVPPPFVSIGIFLRASTFSIG